ncbi:hypothetical protein F0562_015447 [Nyssa sinensis]|uniref:Aminotransferase-like plant mobile domain-containing protein n=1 Tax=Nyssa sinensis TaxID=561372 RepID=A0A5J4ZH28_9ASTE|nr:hypothetical protein F0562_015447 [Nyssa sinensis]
MPHRTRPVTSLLLFTGLNVILVSTITPVYDFVCFLPYWERRDSKLDGTSDSSPYLLVGIFHLSVNLLDLGDTSGLLVKNRQVPPVPVDAFWRRAPYLGVKEDIISSGVEAFTFEGEVPKDPLFLCSEIGLEESTAVLPESILRLFSKEGTSLILSCNTRPPFAQRLIGKSEQMIFLQTCHSGVFWRGHRFLKVLNFCQLDCRRELGSLGTLVSRWSTTTHNFVTPWGEFNPTFEDVTVLFRLSLLGEGTSATLAIDEEEIEGHNFLVSCPTKCASSRCILPMPPEDGPNMTIFTFVVKLARGKIIELAPLFLRLLYHRLDIIHEASRRSVGRYDVASYAVTTFLQIFLFERFKDYAKPHVFPCTKVLDGKARTTKVVPNTISRASRWRGKGTHKTLAQLMDVEENFVFRPYVSPFQGEKDLLLYPRDITSISIHEDSVSELGCIWGAILTPFCLPVRDELLDCSVTYNPHWVACQFGFD